MSEIKKDYEALKMEYNRLATENLILREELDYFKTLVNKATIIVGGKEE